MRFDAGTVASNAGIKTITKREGWVARFLFKIYRPSVPGNPGACLPRGIRTNPYSPEKHASITLKLGLVFVIRAAFLLRYVHPSGGPTIPKSFHSEEIIPGALAESTLYGPSGLT